MLSSNSALSPRMPLAVVLSLAALLVAAGCSRRPADTEIANAVQSQIQQNTAIHGEVAAESKAGVVSLNGHVSTEAERLLASRDAATISGVKEVVNNLTVVPVAPAESAPAAEPERAPAAPARNRRPARYHSAAAPENHDDDAAPVADAAPAASPARAAPVAPPQAVASTPAPQPPPPPPAPVKHTIPAGTTIAVRLTGSLDSARNRAGDTFRATLNAPIREDGEVVVPAGADVEGRIVDASSAGRFSGHSALRLELTKLIYHGEAYPLETSAYDRSGDSRGKGSAEVVGGGAALGAIIGAIAGGGKGAAIGTLAGAGAGGAARGAKAPESLHIPAESVLTFRLQQPVTVMPGKSSGDTRTPMARENQ